MAKAIRDIEKAEPTKQEQQAESINELLESLSENHDALITTLEIIQELQKAGVLDMIKGLLRTRTQVGSLAIEQLNQPEMHRLIKNGTNAFEFLTELDPDQLKTMLNAVSSGLEQSSESIEKKEQVTMWQLVRSVRDPNVNSTMATMISFLKGMGEGLNKKSVH